MYDSLLESDTHTFAPFVHLCIAYILSNADARQDVEEM